MTKWPLTKLRGKIHVKHGFPFKGEYFKSSGPYVVLTPGNFHEAGGFKRNEGKDKCYDEAFPEEYLMKIGDVLVAMTEQTDGLLGSMAIIPEDGKFLHNQRLGLVTALTDEVRTEFIYHLFKTQTVREQLRLSASGSKVKHTSPDRIYDVIAALPTRCEQIKIAAVLSALDAKIELNRRVNEELEGLAKLLYDYWFVQHDFPLSAAQAAALGQPRLQGRPYRASGGPMTYHPTLKREIPKGWEVSTIGQTFSTHLGGTPSRKEPSFWNPGEIAWLSSGEKEQLFVTAPDEKISHRGLSNSAATLLPEGTVILSIVRHIRASILGISAATNQSVLGIKETKVFKNCFIYPFVVREIPRYMMLRTGAQQPHINKETVDTTAFALPDHSVIKAYTELAQPFFDQIKVLQTQTQELTALRDWLLPMLMNGQVTVR